MNRKLFPALLYVAGIGGCAVTPSYEPPVVEHLVGKTFEHDPANLDEPPGQPADFQHWWERFEDPVLDTLIVDALQHNIDLRVAAANVLESEALAKAAAGRRWPQLNASTLGDRSFTGSSTGSSFSAGSDRLYTTTYQLGATIAWQADLFGRLRSGAKAAQADWLASQADRTALMHTIVANVIRQRVEVAIAAQRLQVAKDILSSRQLTLEIVNRRYRRGVSNSSAVDVRLARENVYAAQANITALEQNLTLAQHALGVLLGRKPQSRLLSEYSLSTLPALDAGVSGVPAQLLDRRPDLQTAEFRMIASNERIGVALADLYPDITISAGGGWRDAQLSGLFSSESLFGSLMGQLTQTLFAGGALRAEVEAARARFTAQAQSYAASVLAAMRETEDALVANHQLHIRLAQVQQQVTEARQAEELSRGRYARGVEPLLTVLETERRRQTAEDTLLRVQQDYWNARVDLHLAIGGDWFSETALPSGQTAP